MPLLVALLHTAKTNARLRDSGGYYSTGGTASALSAARHGGAFRCLSGSFLREGQMQLSSTLGLLLYLEWSVFNFEAPQLI